MNLRQESESRLLSSHKERENVTHCHPGCCSDDDVAIIIVVVEDVDDADGERMQY